MRVWVRVWVRVRVIDILLPYLACLLHEGAVRLSCRSPPATTAPTLLALASTLTLARERVAGSGVLRISLAAAVPRPQLRRRRRLGLVIGPMREVVVLRPPAGHRVVSQVDGVVGESRADVSGVVVARALSSELVSRCGLESTHGLLGTAIATPAAKDVVQKGREPK